MSQMQTLLVAAAIVVALFWDKGVAAAMSLIKPAALAPPGRLGWQHAMDAVRVIRGRLVETGCLTDEVKESIESIVQALVQGSDK